MWRISLIGRLEVWRPDGTRVWMRSNKSAGLLAMLVLSHGSPVPRAKIAKDLWPGKASHDAHTSLRQAIAALKRSIGEPGLFCVTRDTCYVDISVVDCPDLIALGTPHPESDFPLLLLPELPEPWFQEQRSLLAGSGVPSWAKYPFLSARESCAEAASVAVVLDWAVHHQPASAATLCRVMGDLLQTASPARISGTLAQAKLVCDPGHVDYDWIRLHKAIADTYLVPLAKSTEAFAKISVQAESKGNMELAAHALLYQAAAMSLTGHSHVATTAIRSFVHRHGTQRHTWHSRLLHALGLSLFHDGQFSDGAASLDAAANHLDADSHRFETAHILSNLAWLSAGARLPRASQDLSRAKAFGTAGVWRFEATQLLAEAYLAISSGDHKAAEALIDHAQRATADAVLTSFGQYVLEARACLAAARRDKKASDLHTQASRSLGSMAGQIPSAWDKTRVGAFL